MSAVPALGLAALFCLARAAFDLAGRRYGWGAAGMLAAVGCLVMMVLVPFPDRALRVVPSAGAAR